MRNTDWGDINLLVSFRSTTSAYVNRYHTEVLKNRFLQNAVERCTTVLVQSSEVILVKTKEYCIADLIHLHWILIQTEYWFTRNFDLHGINITVLRNTLNGIKNEFFQFKECLFFWPESQYKKKVEKKSKWGKRIWVTVIKDLIISSFINHSISFHVYKCD